MEINLLFPWNAYKFLFDKFARFLLAAFKSHLNANSTRKILRFLEERRRTLSGLHEDVSIGREESEIKLPMKIHVEENETTTRKIDDIF